MKRLCGTAAALLMLLGVTACGERDQALTATAGVSDTQPWKGAKNSYVAPGYQAGDKLRWEAHLRRRAQDQNEYVKTN